MKTLLLVGIFLLCFTSISMSFNCGKGKLAHEGMNKYQVIKDCGPPISREYVYYSNSTIREEWLYITEAYGKKQMFLLKIDRYGDVAEIVWMGEVK